MPYRTAIESIDLKGWAGGLNREADPFLLALDESPDCLNVDFGLRGEVSKRDGYAKLTSNDLTATAGTHLFSWLKLGGARFLIYVDDTGDLFHTSATALTDPTKAFGTWSDGRTYQMTGLAMNDTFYLTSARTGGPPRKFDGTTWTDLTVTAFDGTANRFPRAMSVLAAHDRAFAFNVKDSGGTDYRSRMHFSRALLPETWDALDYIDFAPDDGQEITKGVLFGEQIIVFKNQSMYALSGVDPDTFAVYPVDQRVGTECPGTVVVAGPELLFFDHRTGVWSYDGSAFAKLDDKINTYLLDNVNQAVVYKAAAFAYRGRYYLSVPWGADSYNSRTFVFDARTQAWTEYDFGFSSAVDHDADFLSAAPAQKVGIYSMLTGTTDAGDNIASHVATAWLSPSEPSYKYRMRRLDLAFSALGNYDVTIEMRRNFNNDPFVSQTVNTSPGGSLWDTAQFDVDDFGTGKAEVVARLTGWNTDDAARWRTCQFVFRENTNEPWQVNRAVAQISKLGRLRGEP